MEQMTTHPKECACIIIVNGKKQKASQQSPYNSEIIFKKKKKEREEEEVVMKTIEIRTHIVNKHGNVFSSITESRFKH